MVECECNARGTQPRDFSFASFPPPHRKLTVDCKPLSRQDAGGGISWGTV